MGRKPKNITDKSTEPKLTMGLIWHAFFTAEQMLGFDKKKHIYSFPSNSKHNPQQKCEEKENTKQETLYDVWIPESYKRYLGSDNGILQSYQLSYLMNGTGALRTKTLQDELVRRTAQMFWDYKTHLEITLEMHIKIFTYLKYKKANNNKILYSYDTVEQVENDIENIWKNEYIAILNQFKSSMLSLILNSEGFLKDNRINNTLFKDIILDNNRDEVERLTILSIFCIFAGPTGSRIENEQYTANKLYKTLYKNNGELIPFTNENDNSEHVLVVDRELIKNAGAKWYSKTKKEGNRFSRLIPNPVIFPLVNRDNIPIYVDYNGTKDLPLIETIQKTTENLYLIGEGGIGKTTSLYTIMDAAYGDKKESIIQQTPLYIELSKAYSCEDFVNGTSLFILHSIQKQILDSIKKHIDLTDQIESLMFYSTSDHPEYILLLDGLNEVSCEKRDGIPIKQMIIDEISKIIENWENARIILTSRSQEDTFDGQLMPLKLSGIDSDTVIKFLEKKLPSERVNAIRNNQKLIEVLRVPLFLKLYSDIKNGQELLSRGEILRAFINQKKNDDNTGSYTELNRAIQIHNSRRNSGTSESGASITFQMKSFILDFIMPEIAWEMVKNNAWHISRESIEECITRVLKLEKYPDTSYCGKYGEKCFSEYTNTFEEDARDVADAIVEVFGGTNPEPHRRYAHIAKNLRECLTMQLGVLEKINSGEYKIIHQHVRDYFAALYHINNLRLAVYLNEEEHKNDFAKGCLTEWVEDPLPSQVLTFIGEALGEKHNAPEYNASKNVWTNIVANLTPKSEPERTLIRRGLGIFRESKDKNQFENNDGYAVWNLIQILKLIRDDLCGEDFSNLDLSGCEFNGHYLGRENLTADFTGAKVNDKTFMPKGHGSVVNTAFFSPTTEKYIVTASGDRTAKIWNAKTCQEIGTLSGHANVLYSASYSPDEKHIITASRDGTCKIWSAETFKEEKNIPYDSVVYSAVFNNNNDDTKAAIALKDGTIHVWDDILGSNPSESFVELKTIDAEYNGINIVRFSKNDRYIIASSNDHTAKIIDAQSCKEIKASPLFHDSGVLYAEFDADTNRIVTSCIDGSVNVWERDGHSFIKSSNTNDANIMKHNKAVFYAVFSPSGKHIASVSEDCTIKIWDSEKYNEIKTISFGHTSVNSIQYDSEGRRFIVSFSDHTFKVFDAITYEDLTTGIEMGHVNSVFSAQFSPDANSIVTALANNYIELWSKGSNGRFKLINRFEGHTSSAYSAQFSPADGKYIVSTSSDKRIIIRPVQPENNQTDDQIRVKPMAHRGTINCAQWNPNNNGQLVTASTDGTCKIWNTKDMSLIGEPLKHGNPVSTACYSNDGKYIVTASGYVASVWKLDSDNTYKCISKDDLKHQRIVSTATFSPDGKRILTTSGDNFAREWKHNSKGKYVLVSKYEMVDVINDAQYFGKYVIAASADGTVMLWHSTNPKIGKPLAPKQIGGVRSVRFSSNGNYIVSSSDDGIALVWEVIHNAPDDSIDCLEIKLIDTIGNIPGIHLEGVDLSNISGKSSLSETVKGYLKANGALFERQEINMEENKQPLTKKVLKLKLR